MRQFQKKRPLERTVVHKGPLLTDAGMQSYGHGLRPVWNMPAAQTQSFTVAM